MIRVFVVADIRLYREGLAEYLARQESVEVVGAAMGGELGAELCRTRPDVVLAQGVPAVRDVAAVAPTAKVLALGVSEIERDVVALAEAGVAGYVGIEASLKELLAAIEGIMRGETTCSPRMAATLLRRISVLSSGSPKAMAEAEGSDGSTRPRLTIREREILILIDRGRSNKEIAAHLQIEISTVKNHVHSILQKLQVRRRAEAAAWARAHETRGIGAARI